MKTIEAVAPVKAIEVVEQKLAETKDHIAARKIAQAKLERRIAAQEKVYNAYMRGVSR